MTAPSGPEGDTPEVLRLPALPSTEFWTPTQWAVLFSLADAALAPLVPESDLADKSRQIRVPDARFDELLLPVTAPGIADRELVKKTLAARFSDDPACASHLRRTVATILPPTQRRKLGDALAHASTRLGAFLLTGYCTAVQDQPVHVQEAILRGWERSRLVSLRLLAKTVFSLTRLAWVQASPLFKQLTGYRDAPASWKPGPAFDFDFLQFPPLPSPSGEKEGAAASAATKDAEGPLTVDTDVVIVGSGCGGGVCAKILAEAGHRVLVLDKGYYFPPSQLPMPQEEGSKLLMENGGVVASTDGSINTVAGSTWGGGGTVNWRVSLQTQGYVRREWSRDHGLSFFETQDFQDGLDRACAFMGAAPGSEHAVRQSHRGQVLLDGCRRLGWHAAPLPQNCARADHQCGRCMLGCAAAEKQGPAVSWLPAAARAGATFVEGFTVDRVLFDDDRGAGDSRVARGIVGTWLSRDKDGGFAGPREERVEREVVVKAKKVILSAGSFWSPVILSKSGLTNRHIGHHLHLHPCLMVAAFYKERTEPWEEGIVTSYCTSFENLDGHGHGVKLMPTCQVPYTTLPMLPWRGGADFKLAAARYAHCDVYIVLTRDRDTGRVSRDPTTGRPVMHYTPSDFDRAHTLEGVIALAKCCYIMGATEIRVCLPGTEPFVRDTTTPTDDDETKPAATAADEGDYVESRTRKTAGKKDPSASQSPTSSPSATTTPSTPKLDLGVSDPAFTAWLDSVRRAGSAPPLAPFTSAHQMGTCRMSINDQGGVVDPRGKVWGAENLFVADASVFPSASGVNPMITIMAIADWIARAVGRELVVGGAS